MIFGRLKMEDLATNFGTVYPIRENDDEPSNLGEAYVQFFGEPYFQLF